MTKLKLSTIVTNTIKNYRDWFPNLILCGIKNTIPVTYQNTCTLSSKGSHMELEPFRIFPLKVIHLIGIQLVISYPVQFLIFKFFIRVWPLPLFWLDWVFDSLCEGPTWSPMCLFKKKHITMVSNNSSSIPLI